MPKIFIKKFLAALITLFTFPKVCLTICKVKRKHCEPAYSLMLSGYARVTDFCSKLVTVDLVSENQMVNTTFVAEMPLKRF